MTRGFVTIATGDQRYYEMAANLLASYRHFSAAPMPFALICDMRNRIADKFDDVVIMENPYCSYLDKLNLPKCAPYDETIFIDADCLAYRDLNDFWNAFEGQADFTAFGFSYPLDYRYAWFKKEDVGEYGEKISFIPDFIGGVYFIRKSAELALFAKTCSDILERYHQLSFRQFTEPADEPILALAMAAHDFDPVDRRLAPICFYPHATSLSTDLPNGVAKYTSKYEPEHDDQLDAYMIHWGSGNTAKPVYLREVVQLRHVQGGAGEGAALAALSASIMKAKIKGGLKTVLSKMRIVGESAPDATQDGV